jgi:hypothetical protein
MIGGFITRGGRDRDVWGIWGGNGRVYIVALSNLFMNLILRCMCSYGSQHYIHTDSESLYSFSILKSFKTLARTSANLKLSVEFCIRVRFDLYLEYSGSWLVVSVVMNK